MTIVVPRLKVRIDWMQRKHEPAVLAIERQRFEFPWSKEDLRRCLRQRNCICMIATHDDRIAGFMVYELHKTRIHILNLAVGCIWSRMGVGSQMAAKLIGKLRPDRRTHILTEVRETNVDAQKFFRSVGFRAVKVLPDFYGGQTDEDAYLFRYDYSGAKP